VKDDTLLLLGIGIAAAVLLTKNPISETASEVGSGIGTAFQGAGSGISEISAGISAPFGFVDSLFGRLTEIVNTRQQPVVTTTTTGQSTQNLISSGQTIFGLSGAQIIQNMATGNPTTPLYDPVSGTGVNSAGFGYSSATDLGPNGTGTGISQTITNPATGSTVTRAPNSLFAGQGFN